MKTSEKIAGLLLCFLVLPAVALKAQPSAPTAIEQQQNFQQTMQPPVISLRPGTNAPETYAGESADVGPQHILRLIPHHTYFEFKLDSEYLYTDNALLTRTQPPIGSSEFVNTLRVAFSPTPYRVGPGRIGPYIGHSSQWYNYGLGGHDLSVIDFNVQSAFVGARYLLPQNWLVYGECDYNWFLSQQNYSDFYHEFVPSLGVQKLIQLDPNTVIAASFEGDYHASYTANPPHHSQDRADGILSLSLSWQLTRHLVVQPYYRFQYTYYRFNTSNNSGRSDYLNSFGISAAWYFTPDISLRTFVNRDIKESDDSAAQKYRDFNVGGELAWTFRF